MSAPCVWLLPKPAFACVKLHPNTILAFRKARGVRAKTDRIDAMLIARYLADARGRADLPATFRAD
jgi:transposase